jgi:hypothetical protein
LEGDEESMSCYRCEILDNEIKAIKEDFSKIRLHLHIELEVCRKYNEYLLKLLTDTHNVNVKPIINDEDARFGNRK